MMRGAIPLFRVGGVQVAVHPTWFIVFVLVAWSLGAGFLPDVLPLIDPVEAWILGIVGALLLFGSVLLHELAHSLVAIRRGLPVSSITLFIFGGVSNLTAESKDPRTEFLIAIVGPLTSFVIAGVSWLIAVLPIDDRIAVLFGYLAVVNAVLGAFNLIPGFPLDGGRVLRSFIWRATGQVRRATEIAGAIGQIVGFGFIVLGVVQFFRGDLLGGLWTGAIGWFLQGAAAASVQQLMIDQRLAGVRVRDAFAPDNTTVPPGLTVAELITTFILGAKKRAILVTDNGRLVGIVTMGDVVKVPPELRSKTTVAQVMTPLDRLVTVAPSATLRDAAETLSTHDVDQLPVVEGGRPLGLLTRADVVRELMVREALDIPSPRSPTAGDAPTTARPGETTAEPTGR